MEIKVKRVYDPIEPTDGLRVLVDKIWPRGIKKEDLPIDIWAKDVTPSTEIRQMFHADPEKNYERFAKAYTNELNNSQAFTDFVTQLRESRQPVVTLLFAFHNPQKNHAIVLKECIEQTLSNNK